MANKIKEVSTRMSRKFFDNIFEKERRKMELKTGMRLTQVKFTEIAVTRGAKLIIPKRNLKFAPKEFRRKMR